MDEVLFVALERVWANYPRELLPFMMADWESGEYKYVASIPGGAHAYKIPFATHDQDVTTIETRWPDHTLSALNAIAALHHRVLGPAARVRHHRVLQAPRAGVRERAG